MATLVCSNGHANPVGQRFCGTCGEDLGGDDLSDPGASAARAGSEAVATDELVAAPTPRARRWFPWVALGLAALFAAVAAGAWLAGRHDGSPTAPSDTGAARGTQTVVWYFPVSTPDTELTTAVDQECAAHREVAAIQVNYIDMSSGSLTPVDTRTFPCS